MGRPAIVVSLPATDVPGLKSQAELAHRAGADLAEVRLDRMGRWDPRAVAELFPAPLPLLATIRSRAEGGQGPDDPAERRRLLLEAMKLPFRWIDLELRRDLSVVPQLPRPEAVGRIASLHPGPTAPAAWAGFLREFESVDAIGKLVVPASVRHVTTTLLPLIERTGPGRLVVQTTGGSGPLLRLLSGRLGFPFVYAALPRSAGESAVERSQIPVDELRPFLDAPASAPWYAVVGHPVGHSLSPALQNTWLRASERAGLYVALDLEDEAELLETLPQLVRLGLRGLNVTHPFKRAARNAADDVAPAAAASGAANCLSVGPEGIYAENTDVAAVLRRLTELAASGAWDGRSLVVLGAGGAARATLAAARTLGARATVVARRPSEGKAASAEFGAIDASGRPEPSGMVVHATTVGREGVEVAGVPFEAWVGPGSYVLDWVYRPAAPTVRQIAERNGARYEDGWRLFVYQAAASFALWWGSEPPAESVATALKEGSCAA